MAGERILIVEDEPAVARGLEYALKKEGYEVLWADTGEKALTLARQRDPHLIILDIRLPDLNGFEVCRRMRGEGLRQPILMLTALDEEVDRVVGLEVGADDYVVKPYRLRELIARVRALLRRAYGELAMAAPGERIRFGDIEVDLERLQVTRGGRPVPLTPTEFRLLRFLVTHPNRPFSREELLEAVWGYDREVLDDRTV
ncbi:response regulator transcription factor, partial [Thermoflexus sp.]